VPKKKSSRKKRVPLRTCVGCREVLDKRSLVRIVRRPGEVCVDPTGKLAGRGAYLHDKQSCWERALKGSLARALKTELTEKDRERLLAHGQQFATIQTANAPNSSAPGDKDLLR
jgi:predicted RNA-binding protein YlxR (DUF448 family)